MSTDQKLHWIQTALTQQVWQFINQVKIKTTQILQCALWNKSDCLPKYEVYLNGQNVFVGWYCQASYMFYETLCNVSNQHLIHRPICSKNDHFPHIIVIHSVILDIYSSWNWNFQLICLHHPSEILIFIILCYSEWMVMVLILKQLCILVIIVCQF